MRTIPALNKAFNIIWFPAFVASMIFSVLGIAINNYPLIVIFKSMFVPLLALWTYMKWQSQLTRVFWYLQIALLCALLGDIFMVFIKESEVFLIIGGTLFSVQHIFYILLNLMARKKDVIIWKAPYWGLPHFGYVFLFSTLYLCKATFHIKFQSFIYAFFLGSTFLTAFHRETKNSVKHWILIIGCLCFLVSDTLIFLDLYLFPMTDVASTSILVTYYIAQICICYGNLPSTN